MEWFKDALGAVVPALFIALSSAAVFALLRMISPTVRWRRQLQADGAVLGMLPPGKERDLWEQRVLAQAQRLRRYRESITPIDQIWGWCGLVTLAIFIPVIVAEASLGWPSARIDGEPVVFLAFANIALLAIGGVRMILGQGISNEQFDYARMRIVRIRERRRAQARFVAWLRATRIKRRRNQKTRAAAKAV